MKNLSFVIFVFFASLLLLPLIPFSNLFAESSDYREGKKGAELADKTIEGIDVEKIDSKQGGKDEVSSTLSVVKINDTDIDDMTSYRIDGPSDKSIAVNSDKNSAQNMDGSREVANVTSGSEKRSIPLLGNKKLGVVKGKGKSAAVPDYTGVMWEYGDKTEFKPEIDRSIIDDK